MASARFWRCQVPSVIMPTRPSLKSCKSLSVWYSTGTCLLEGAEQACPCQAVLIVESRRAIRIDPFTAQAIEMGAGVHETAVEHGAHRSALGRRLGEGDQLIESRRGDGRQGAVAVQDDALQAERQAERASL